MAATGADASKSAEFERLIKERNYYRLLSVERSCSADELKKAYRKMALRLHPDRNLGMEEDATVLFAKVQAAYDILSDPQERAYYDQYGSRRGPGGFNTNYDEEDVDESPGARFTTTETVREWISKTERYQGQNPGGEPKFYKAAGELFKKLAQEERDAQDKFDPLWDPLPSIFGGSKTNYEDELIDFYNRWVSFSTRKSFSWFDKYDVRYAEDRRTRRAMDAANNRAREAEKRKFNEAVRAFARFIKKNDPRHKRHVAKTNGGNANVAADKNKKTAKELSEEYRKRNAQERNQYEQQDWEKISGDEYEDYFESDKESNAKGKGNSKNGTTKNASASASNVNSDGESEDNGEFVREESKTAEGEDDEDADIVEVFECVVCDKTFKTQKQLVAHERSKKHIKAADELRKQMLKEEQEMLKKKEALAQEEEESESDDSTNKRTSGFGALMSDSEEEESEEEVSKKPNGFSALAEDSDDEESDEEAPKARPSGFGALLEESDEEEEEESEDEPPKKPNGFGALMSDSENEDQDSSDNQSSSNEGKVNGDKEDKKEGISPSNSNQSKSKVDINELLAQLEGTKLTGNDASDTESKQPKKVGKAKQRRMKRTAGTDQNTAENLGCNVCKQSFSSKNKLFDHIRHTGHAANGRR